MWLALRNSAKNCFLKFREVIRDCLEHPEMFKDLAARGSELPANRPILAYRRGPYCVTALNGTSWLRDLGIAADRLRFGTPEWNRPLNLGAAPNATLIP